MKTSAVLSLRHLTSKIHPPLPLNARDSRVLLSLLTSSFRQHLDQEHGKVEFSKANATDIHFQSLLDNPLLNTAPQKAAILMGAKGLKSSEGHESALGDVQDLLMSPLEYFKSQIASGAASIDLATSCLKAYLNGPSLLNGEKLDAVLVSDVCSTMLQWLWSSGMEERLEFLEDFGFVRVLVPFLVMDGGDRNLMRWLSKLSIASQKLEASPSMTEVTLPYPLMQSKLLHRIVHSEFQYGSGINGALKIFMNAVESMHEWSAASKLRCYDSNSKPAVRHPLQRAGGYLLTKLGQVELKPRIDQGTFHNFCRGIELWSPRESLEYAVVAMLHPLYPKPQVALHYIRNEMPYTIKTYNSSRRRRAFELCLHTREILLSHGRETEALQVSDIMRDIFKRESANSVQENEPDNCSEKHLRGLEALVVT